MTAKNVTNHHDGALGMPAGGPLIPPGRTARVDRWEIVSENQVVKAWLAAGVLTISDVEGEPEGEAPTNEGTEVQRQAPAGTADNQGTPAAVKTKDELEAMTKDDLTLYIEKELGGDAKSNMTKADLVSLALDLQD